MNLNRIYVFSCFLLLHLSFCVPFPYLEPSESLRQQIPKQQQKTNQPENAVIKETFEGDADKQPHIQQKGEEKLASAEVTEKETKFDHSVEDVTELRFPLDTVITQIEDDANDFHVQMELHQQGEPGTEKGTETLERAKLTFGPPHDAADEEALSISESDANDETFNKSGTKLNETEEEEDKSNRKEAKSKSEKVEEKANKSNGKTANGTTEEQIEQNVAEKAEQQREEAKGRTIAAIRKGGNGARSLPPIIDVGGIATEEANEEEEEKKETDEKGKTELTWWDKIVLGLRCARHDCRETLIVKNEQLPRVINGWKITRKARSTVDEEREENLGIQFGNYCKCKI